MKGSLGFVSVTHLINIYAKGLTVFATTVVILRHKVSEPKIFDLGHLFNLTQSYPWLKKNFNWRSNFALLSAWHMSSKHLLCLVSSYYEVYISIAVYNVIV